MRFGVLHPVVELVMICDAAHYPFHEGVNEPWRMRMTFY